MFGNMAWMQDYEDSGSENYEDYCGDRRTSCGSCSFSLGLL